MDKTNIVNTFTEVVDQLRNTECSQKEKIACFQRVSECIMAPTMAGHLNYATFCSKAVNILLLFCEDLDSVVRISAEENLNKIFRVLEKSRVNRILMDLYGEIKRNGNQRSLRICLRIFGYYAPRIRENNLRWYAQNLSSCLKVISKRKETLLQETLAEFVLKFGRHIQPGLTDSETCKLFEVFIGNIGSDCAVKRRCTAQNCINLLENSCNKQLMAKYALNKVIEILLNDHEPNTIIGVLGFLRQLVVIAIRVFTLHTHDNDDSFGSHKSPKTTANSEECRQLLEIYDYCLHLVSTTPTSQHSLINAALEVINAILQSLEGFSLRDAKNNPHLGPLLLQLINDKHLKHGAYLKARNTMKHQIFNINPLDEMERAMGESQGGDNATWQTASDIILQPQQQQQHQQRQRDMLATTSMPAAGVTSALAMQRQQQQQLQQKRQSARSISECVDIDYVDEDEVIGGAGAGAGASEDSDGDGDFTTLLASAASSVHVEDGGGVGGDGGDIGSLLGNIDFATKTSSSVINETISGRAGDVACGAGGVVGDRLRLPAGADALGGGPKNLLVNLGSDDEKSIQLSHTDNESVNSIEFKAENSRGLVVEGVSHTQRDHQQPHQPASSDAVDADTKEAGSSKSGSDAFTAFFNNFNAASESVTKLFRSSSITSTTKSAVSPSKTADSISLISNVSSLKRLETEVEVFEDSSPESSKTYPTPSTAIMGEVRSLDSLDAHSNSDVKPMDTEEFKDTPKRISRNPFLTSTLPYADSATGSLPPPLPVNIGSMFEQTLLSYTARLIAARFLLTGRPRGLCDDSNVRVSIKNISLNVIAQCVRLSPELLEVTLKFLESEELPVKTADKSQPDGSNRQSPIQIPSDSSSNVGQDYEHLEMNSNNTEIASMPQKPAFNQLDIFRMDENNEGPLLEIIDDHFGKSSNDFNFSMPTNTMTRSADPVLFSKSQSPLMSAKSDKLYTSEIIGSEMKLRDFVEITKAEEDMPPEMEAPPKPPKRTKTFRKSKRSKWSPKKTQLMDADLEKGDQYMMDILHYYSHEDPILRAGIQTIIGHYCRSSLAGLERHNRIHLQWLLAILCVGLQDDIHTVVIQALNTFDKIFPYVLFKYMTTSMAGHKSCQQQRQAPNKEERQQPQQEKSTCGSGSGSSSSDSARGDHINIKCIGGHLNDNDGIIAALLSAFQFQQTNFNDISSSNSRAQAPQQHQQQQQSHSNAANNHITDADALPAPQAGNASLSHCAQCGAHSPDNVYVHLACNCQANSNSNNDNNTNNTLLFISPKLLLSKLRLCHYNKYWLVQNKYAEVISNLNYASLRSYYGNNYTIARNCCTISLHHPSTSPISPSCCCCANGRPCLCRWWPEDDVDGSDFVCNLENSFMDELLQLIADDDVRVRENASKCLCRFVLHAAQSSKSLQQHQRQQQQQQQPQQPPLSHDCQSQMQSPPPSKSSLNQRQDANAWLRAYGENLRMLENFLEYGIFNDLPPAMQYVLHPQSQQRQQADPDILTCLDNALRCPGPMANDEAGNNYQEIEMVLSKLLYRLTNKIISLKEKNVQFGIIYCVKELLKYFPFADYANAWSEFNFTEIFVKLSQYNYNTAVDLTCQSDLIDVSAKLIVGSSLLHPSARKQNNDLTIGLLKHTMKIINIYYHIFTNQKPLIMAKSQKVELFGNAKEWAITQCLGYFGSEYIYVRLYQMLKSAWDNFKITINEEAGSKLISLLKTCLNTLSGCIEMLPHEAAGGSAAGTSGGATASGGGGGIGLAKSATDVNAVATAAAAASPSASASATTVAAAALAASGGSPVGGGGGGGGECIAVLKLIEETLQYLTKVINYAPEESIACLRQLLKYLFARNYGNRQQQQHQQHHQTKQQDPGPAFLESYFRAKRQELHYLSQGDNEPAVASACVGAAMKQTNNQQPSSSFTEATTNVAPSTTATAAATMQLQPSMGSRHLPLKDAPDPAEGISSSSSGLSSKLGTVGHHQQQQQDDYLLLAQLFASGLEYYTWKSPHEAELSRHIKLFEPLVMQCLTLFLKCNGRVQAQILKLLVQLLDVNVTYSILDAKNVIFDYINKGLDTIEMGIARNGAYQITPMIKFLIKLSGKHERNLITIPKIISIINNLLANCNIRDVAIEALTTLTYELFLITAAPLPQDPKRLGYNDPNPLAAITENLRTLNDELDTQKEVILGMLEKFIESGECQQLLSLLLLIEQLQQQRRRQREVATTPTTPGRAEPQHNKIACLPNLDTVCNMICHSICSNRLPIQDWHTYAMVETYFKNNTKYLLGNSKEFMALLRYTVEGDVANFSDLSYATIILSNVILKTEEIYLVNHIKLYLKNHPTTLEKLQQRQQQHWQLQQPPTGLSPAKTQRLPATNDKPSTSTAARAAAAAAAASADSPAGARLNEYNYLSAALCDVLFQCLEALEDQRRSAHSHSHQLAMEYCRLACNFVKVLNKLCGHHHTRSEEMLLATGIRSLLNGCESKLLNEYYNLLLWCSTLGCPAGSFAPPASMGSATATASINSATTSSWSLSSISSSASPAAANTDDLGRNVVLQLQLEMFQLLSALGVLDTLTLLQRLQQSDTSNHVRRALLNKVCHHSMPYAMEWNLQQVQHLFNANFLNILIVEQFAFVCNLCEADEEFCSVFQATLLANIQVLNKHAIQGLLRLVECLCKKPDDCSILRFAKFLQILNKLHKFMQTSETLPSTSAAPSAETSSPPSFAAAGHGRGPLQLQIERLVRHLIANSSDAYDKNAIYDTFVHLIEEDEEQQQMSAAITKDGMALSSASLAAVGTATATAAAGGGGGATTSTSLTSSKPYSSDRLQFMILNDLENSCDPAEEDASSSNSSSGSGIPPGNVCNIVDEKWIFNQLIKFSARHDYDPIQIVKILLEIQSENKLQTIFNNGSFDALRILQHTISHALQAMLQTFRNNCIQYNPHIHYMRPNPLARVSLAQLMTRIGAVMEEQHRSHRLQCHHIARTGDGGDTGSSHAEATVAKEEKVNDATTGPGGQATNVQDCDHQPYVHAHLCGAVIALMESIKQIEVTALIYIESKFIDKFLSEHLLRPEHVNALLRFMGLSCQWVLQSLEAAHGPSATGSAEQRNAITVSLQCIDALLHQKLIWAALNQQAAVPKAPGQGEPGSRPLTKCELNTIICSLLDVVCRAGTLLLDNSLFYKKHKSVISCRRQHCYTQEHQLHQSRLCCNILGESFENVSWLTATYNPIAIFLAKLIETKMDNSSAGMACNSHYSSAAADIAISAFGPMSEEPELRGINKQYDYISLDTLISIGIFALRTNLFYATAVTPLEIMQQQQRLQQSGASISSSPSNSPGHKSQLSTTTSTAASAAAAAVAATTSINSMLPIIPIESLSDVDILKSFVKRLSIFGFTTRQQFEEYFMTFLLLINKVYDENMVDQQEQYQIRSVCLEAIMELLITYKSFPIVGNKLSLYHHTTRWNRINCDSISLKKLHEIQLIISPANVFYHSNLERNLRRDCVIGTQNFGANQFDLNFMWQQMEATSSAQNSPLTEETELGGDDISIQSNNSNAQSPAAKHLNGAAANTAYRNYQYFTKQSGVDYKSSSQLIFDVLMQMIEQNHILILPNLVKFTEICENREQIKQIWEKADYLKSHIPMDDTISHQHLIYLLCKTKGLLIPTHVEMITLESLIKNYLKSSHLFVRCAALNGLLSLLESYAKTSTTIGKLSDELVRLKEIVLNYIDKNGLIEESSLQCSDLHTKLIWTLNYCLMEWTSKLDPHCNVAYHTKLTVNKLLRNCSNEEIYLCVLHGLERIIVLDNKVSSISGGGGGGGIGGSTGGGIADRQNQALRPSIEKLALELAKLENEKFSIPALKLLLSCIYVGSSRQLENTELNNGIVQDDPEIIAQQTDKVDVLLQCIKSATKEAAWIYGQVLCQMIRDLVPPKEILTKVIKEFLAINQPHSDVIAMIVFQVFRSAIDSSFQQQLQDWLTCSLPTFLALPQPKAVWSLSVVFLAASINLHLTKLFPLLLSAGRRGHTPSATAAAVAAAGTSAASTPASIATLATATSPTASTATTATTATTISLARKSCGKLGHHEIALFVTAAQDFYAKLGPEQKLRFRDAFKEFHHIRVYSRMLQSL